MSAAAGGCTRRRIHSNTAARASSPVANIVRWTSSRFREAKKLSTGALS